MREELFRSGVAVYPESFEAAETITACLYQGFV